MRRSDARGRRREPPGIGPDGGAPSPALAVGTTAQAVAAVRAGTVTPQAVPVLQRAAGNAAVASAMDDLDGSMVHTVIRGGGQPLDQPVLRAMESHLGTDLSDVRVHADDQATRSAAAIDAQAYTAGNHVVFQRRLYQPGTTSGLRMLAHELTHVVQQRNGPVAGSPVAGGVNVSDPSDRFEQAAERSARAFVHTAGRVESPPTAETDDLA